MLPISQIYEIELEIINTTNEPFYFSAQIKAPHEEGDQKPQEHKCIKDRCKFKAKSPTSFIYEVKNPNLSHHKCYMSNKHIKRLRLQPFLQDNPHRGIYTLYVSKRNRCQIDSSLVNHDPKRWFKMKLIS